VTGCYAGVAADTLRAIPGVDLVVPQAEKDGLVSLVLEIIGSNRPDEIATAQIVGAPRNDIKLDSQLTPRHRANLKVQDGCDNRCAYCIVPDARGKPVSLSEDQILAKAADLAAGGTREIILTGINLGKYRDLTGLIRKLQETPGLGRLRLSSIEPEDVTDEIMELLPLHFRICANTAFAQMQGMDSMGLCPHLHIPLQSGDDGVLRRMRRRYTAAGYLEIIKKARAACPDVAITTDVIVGFPGETDEELGNTYRFLEEAEFARLHVFKYSKRSGTPAADMPDQVPAQIKAERSEALRELSTRLEAAYRKRFIGRELEVLVEKASDGRLTGTSENYLTVTFEGKPELVGKLVRVRLGK
jgi:threonylcarbamoyladenosine tRNA methylthiotransferase MtaB